MKTPLHFIEPLEPRIAPASVFPYTDVDGDKVTITLSAGTLGVSLLAGPIGSIAGTITITGAAEGANLTVAVTKGPQGDGLANVGLINASGIDLGTVNVKGDLGKILCGDGNADMPALKSLLVRSMGRFGTATQGGGDLVTFLTGDVGSVKVTSDVEDVFLGISGKLGSLAIGGSLTGGAATDNGRIFVAGDLGKVTIGKNIVGGEGARAGSVEGLTGIGSASIGGSVVGGSGSRAGSIVSNGDLRMVKIAKELVGGTGEFSGAIIGGDDDKIGSVMIGGSISGGAGRFSGGVFAGDPGFGAGTASLGNVTVAGSLFGGFGEYSGVIHSLRGMGAVKVGHDVIGGSGEESGSIQNPASATKSISVGGSVVGGSADESGQIETDNISGAVTIGGSIVGGTKPYTGFVSAGSVGGGVMVRGSIIGPKADPNGGSPSDAGVIAVDDTKAITVLGDLVGGSISGTASMQYVGEIRAGNVGGILIGGSIIAGTDSSAGSINESGGIRVFSAGSITVKGSIVGNPTNRAFITVEGLSAGTPGLALGKLTVGGSVEHALIEVASDPGFGARNGAVGAVKVGGDWIASSIASGVASGNGIYGDAGDALIAGAISRITSIAISGAVRGTQVGGDSFAFIAREIDTFKASGTSFPRALGVDDPDVIFSRETGGDVVLREL